MKNENPIGSEGKLRAIFDNIHTALFIHKPDGTLIDVNASMLRLYKVSRDEAIRYNIRDDYSGPNAPKEKLDEYWRQAVQGKAPVFEWEARRPGDGSIFPAEVRLDSFKVVDDSFIMATVRDLTKQRRAEQKSRISDERFKALFEYAIDAIIIEDEDQRILDANQKACNLFGYRRDELIQKTLPDLHAERETVLPIYDSPDHEMTAPMEVTVRHKAGRSIPIEFTITAFEADGQTLFMSIIRDISERKRTEEALRMSEGSIKRAYMAKQRQMDQIASVHAQFLRNTFDSHGGLEFAAHCRPAADVGGDFYFVQPLDDGRVAICIADVSGHGAAAAVATATSKALLSVSLQEMSPDDGPGEVLCRTSNWLRGQLGSEQFVTVWLAIWCPATKELLYTSAAHPPAVLYPNGGTPSYLPQTACLPIGLILGNNELSPESHRVRLEKGDRVLIYTDGWTESASRSDEYLEGDGFLELLHSTEGQIVSAVPILLFTEFERHVANSQVRDDVTLLVFDRVE